MSIAIARGWQSASLPPTYRAMALLPPTVGPRAALKDLTAFMRQRSREQIIGASLAVLVTIIIVIIFFVDSKINTAPPRSADDLFAAALPHECGQVAQGRAGPDHGRKDGHGAICRRHHRPRPAPGG